MTEPQTVDLVVLGGGSGGYAAALRAAELGMSVVMVEKDKVGGTCLHRGCIPTKALLHSAEIVDTFKESAQFGVLGSFDKVDMAGVNSYKDKVVEGLFKGLTGLVKSRKIEVVQGTGKLVSPTAVEVARRCRRIEAGHVLLATGSVPRSLPGLEVDHDRVITSDDALQMDTIPGSVDHPRRRRDRLRVRLRLELVRRRGHDRRGAAAPRAAGGGEQQQAARARVPQARHQAGARRPVRERHPDRQRREGHASRAARRSRPSCCSSRSAAAR